MRYPPIAAMIFVIAFVVSGCTSERYAHNERYRASKPDTLAAMKEQDVISLSKAGVSDSLIITMLAVSNSWFQLKTQDVLDLKNAGVSDKVIDAMIESNEPLSEGSRVGEDGYYYYPPYYWYAGYYPFRYYPSFYMGYGFSYYPHFYTRYGGYSYRRSFGNSGSHGVMRGSGRRR